MISTSVRLIIGLLLVFRYDDLVAKAKAIVGDFIGGLLRLEEDITGGQEDMT